MTHVVAEPCFNCKYTDCVTVCPVECFYEGEQMVYIHPEECIDCEACVPECPVEAIFHEEADSHQKRERTRPGVDGSPQEFTSRNHTRYATSATRRRRAG